MMLTDEHTELIEKSKHWAVSQAREIAKKYYHVSEGDIENVAYDALTDIAERWNREKGAWSTFMYVTFKHEAHRGFIKLRGAKRSGKLNTVRPGPESLNVVVYGSDNSNQLEVIDLLVDKTVKQQLDAAEIRADIKLALENIPTRERAVIFRYFFLDETLEAIGKQLGVSIERVRQLRDKALTQLRLVLSK